MGYVLYVGFATHRRATVRIYLYFKRLMFMKCFVYKKKRVVTDFVMRKALSDKLYSLKFSLKMSSVLQN